MFDPLGAGDGLVVLIMFVLAWAIPILFALWFIRTLTTMAAAQREIAARLGGIEQCLRAGRSPSDLV